MTAPYQALSRVYDAGWADFSIQYAPLVGECLQARGIQKARVLDLGCGTGVLALALARAGHAVRGVDASLPMLRLAREKARGVKGVRFVRGDLTDPQPGGPYDVTVCAYDAINYLRRLADLKKLFRNVSAALKEGGLFLFDSNTAVMYRHQSGPTATREVNGVIILEDTSYDARYKLATTTFAFPDGSYEIHRQRPYSFDELAPRLEAAGLRVTERFAWFSRLPSTPGAPKVFVIAEKSIPELEQHPSWQTPSSCTAPRGARTAPAPSASSNATTSPTPGSTSKKTPKPAAS
jgi:SAM-dependent methyltransferase